MSGFLVGSGKADKPKNIISLQFDHDSFNSTINHQYAFVDNPLHNNSQYLEPSAQSPQIRTGKIFFTSYNPVVEQNDSSPCIGASGKDQCALAKTGQRMIALSQDLVGRSPSKLFHYGDIVTLESELNDPRCNGQFMVVDTMNKRFRQRGDIFMPDRKNNVSCTAVVMKS